MNSLDLAWAAGFFDGEGYAGLRKNRREGGRLYGSPVVSIAQVDRFVLDRFCAIMGVGKVNEPYSDARYSNQNPQFDYSVSRWADTQNVVVQLWPWLSPIKRMQCYEVLREYRRFVQNYRNKPSTGWPTVTLPIGSPDFFADFCFSDQVHEIAWAAGFFDGEGYVGFDPSGYSFTGCPRIAIPQKHPLVLERFRHAIGCGKITVPFSNGEFGVYRLRIDGWRPVQYAISQLWRFLSPIKRQQAHKVLGKWKNDQLSSDDWAPRGEKHGRSKITANQAREIHDRGRSGQTSGYALAREFGLDASTVSDIVSEKIWNELWKPADSESNWIPRVGNCKISEVLAREIHDRVHRGVETRAEIARRLDLGWTTVDHIVQERTWKHLWKKEN